MNRANHENTAGRPRISDCLRQGQAEILAGWERAVRQLPIARELERPLLLDHIPALIERIAQSADELSEGQSSPPTSGIAERHARERLELGFGLPQIVAEYAALRATIFRHLWEQRVMPDSLDALLVLNEAIDTGIAIAVQHTHAAMKQLVARIDFERQRYFDLVNTLNHAVVWEADAHTLAFSFVSLTSTGLTGRSPEEWMSTPDFWSSYVPAEDKEVLFGLFERCRTEQTAGRCEHRFVRSDGVMLWLHTGVNFRLVDGKAQFTGVTVDVTELKRTIEARDRVLGVVSHDLRNPLGVIAAGASAISMAAAPDESGARIRRQAELVGRNARLMARMISDLSDVASLEAGHLSVRLTAEDASRLVDEALASGLEERARKKGVSLRSEVAPNLPRVSADHDRFLQIFTNLVNNAINATDAGGAVLVRAEASRGEVVFSVADTGRGIDEHQLPHLFEAYWRADPAAYKGTGLGLPIVKGLVEAHGGRIWVESEVGRGTTFFFTLPTDESVKG
ncbi:ATP-binding protein [Polyangium aurulentum]|uniref:ATP-binding protein n=1 Tax=Polyangium aurulentum TaxID=2567896 RepID=UPI00146F5764|nr:ATP-binding protein [Polyangium aurulentum]UQA60289.1 PAS domain-containing protein [Polyangium aurulentum]